MTRSTTILAGMLAASLAALVAVAAAVALDAGEPKLEARLERACHSEIAKRSPTGFRNLQTVRHEIEGATVAVAAGSLETEHRRGHWSSIKWTCRVDVETAEILRVVFKQPRTTPRFSAISRAS